jgi:hypothetical protein
MVSTHTAYGIAQAEICAILNITLPTLHKHFRMELNTGLARANAVMAEALFRQGTKLNSTNATIFWLRTRAKWTEARPDARDEEGGERTGSPGGCRMTRVLSPTRSNTLQTAPAFRQVV